MDGTIFYFHFSHSCKPPFQLSLDLPIGKPRIWEKTRDGKNVWSTKKKCVEHRVQNASI